MFDRENLLLEEVNITLIRSDLYLIRRALKYYEINQLGYNDPLGKKHLFKVLDKIENV